MCMSLTTICVESTFPEKYISDFSLKPYCYSDKNEELFVYDTDLSVKMIQ